MIDALLQACQHALRHNLKIKPDENVLIVTDETKREIGLAFKNAAFHFSDHVELIEIPLQEFNGQEPPDFAAQKMQTADVILMPTAKSLSWTKARMTATEKGARIASMPRITAEMILRTFPMDYGPVKARVNKLCDLLDETREVRIATELGTNITIGITGRKSHGRKGGIYTEKGHWGNLPCGEAFIAPIAGSSAGVYVIDASHAGVGRLTEPLKITVENGFAVAFEGGSQAEALAEMLAAVGDPNAYNIAELGFGCNDKAGICGITLEDEKVLGTCHIALGNNIYFGGTVAVGVHVDGVMTRPTAWFDEQRIIENGELLI